MNEINTITMSIEDGSSNGDRNKKYEKPNRALVRKLDKRLIPFLTFLELFSFLNRINIGHANLAGIDKALSLTQTQWSLAVMMYFIGFMVLEIPSTLLMRRIGPTKFLSFIMIIWGGIMVSMAFVGNAAGLITARFFLGVAQAGFFPGVIFYFSVWYVREKHVFRMAMFYCGALLSGAVGGLLGYGINQLECRTSLYGWQWIFILEGVPCVLLGIATYFCLGDLPETVQWLRNTEKEILTRNLRRDISLSCNSENGFSWRQVLCAFTDGKLYIYLLIYVSNSIAAHSLIMFSPTFIKRGTDCSIANAQLMSALPPIIACGSTLIISFSAGRFQERGFHLALTSFLGAVGYILLVQVSTRGSIMICIFICLTSVGTYSPIPLIMSWFTNNIGGHTKRAVASGLIIGFGNISGIVVGHIYRLEDGPDFKRGHYINGSCMIVTGLASLMMKYLLFRENQRRARLTIEERTEELSQCGSEPCDAHPDFQYVT